jgi:hypothetical protein
MKNLLKKHPVFFQVMAVVFITFCLAEVSLRVYNYYFPSFIFYSGSYDRFRGKPFADDWDFKLNSQGFKDKEFSEKKKNVYRILGVGDSFSFGVVPYRYNYLTLIESSLGRGNSVEVLNMGIPSIGPKDYLALLVKEGLPLQPDMVLLSFFIGNDFVEKKGKEFYEYSFVAALFRYVFFLQPRYEGQILHGNGEYCDDCPSFAEKQYLKIEYDRSLIFLEDNETFDRQLKNTMYYLKQIREVCSRNKIKLVIALIPDELQVNPDLLRALKKSYYPDKVSGELDITLPNTRLGAELGKLGIDYIDLYSAFAHSSEPLYRKRNTHWNIAGNQRAAVSIAKYIQRYM